MNGDSKAVLECVTDELSQTKALTDPFYGTGIHFTCEVNHIQVHGHPPPGGTPGGRKHKKHPHNVRKKKAK